MACAPCIAAAAAASSNSSYSSFNYTSESNYTVPQLQIWLSKLNCIKLQHKYADYNITPSTLNSYLGIVQSAIRNPENIGYFEQGLITIENIIITVINNNDC